MAAGDILRSAEERYHTVGFATSFSWTSKSIISSDRWKDKCNYIKEISTNSPGMKRIILLSLNDNMNEERGSIYCWLLQWTEEKDISDEGEVSWQIPWLDICTENMFCPNLVTGEVGGFGEWWSELRWKGSIMYNFQISGLGKRRETKRKLDMVKIWVTLLVSH